MRVDLSQSHRDRWPQRTRKWLHTWRETEKSSSSRFEFFFFFFSPRIVSLFIAWNRVTGKAVLTKQTMRRTMEEEDEARQRYTTYVTTANNANEPTPPSFLLFFFQEILVPELRKLFQYVSVIDKKRETVSRNINLVDKACTRRSPRRDYATFENLLR